MLKRVGLIGIIIWVAAVASAAHSIRIVSYNVENLFHPEVDSINPDTDFTPDGSHHWTYARYQRKLTRISRVLATIGEREGVSLITLCEVENRQCLIDLQTIMCRYPYGIVHYDSPGSRGIDVAVLYDSTRLELLHATPLRVPPTHGHPTRDILYTRFDRQGDTLHILSCHLPSQVGGTEALDRRQVIIGFLQEQADSIMAQHPEHHLIIMGDFNDANRQLFTNLYAALGDASNGSYRFHGKWEMLDQFYLSPGLQAHARAAVFAPEWLLEEDEAYPGYKPKRTYIGYRYNKNGYSDHLPVYLDITL